MMVRKAVIAFINAYQKFFSPDTGILTLRRGATCVFYPTCSEYTKEAIEKYGTLRGVYLGVRRILRCHPWQREHIDPLR